MATPSLAKRSLLALFLSFSSLFNPVLSDGTQQNVKRAVLLRDVPALAGVAEHQDLLGKREVDTLEEVKNGTFYLSRRSGQIEAIFARSGCGDPADEMSDTGDGPTNDGSAGIGVEFETGDVQFQKADPDTCQDTYSKLKGFGIENHIQDLWKLTVDTTVDLSLTAEYIILGEYVKVGQGMAGPAAQAMTNDMVNFNPSESTIVRLKGSDCDWKAIIPDSDDDDGKVNVLDYSWAPQITAPLPLEAIQDMIQTSITKDNKENIPLIGKKTRNALSFVTRDSFQSRPNGINGANLQQDVLGFCSLLLSFAKAAKTMDEDQSVKELFFLMPRTDMVEIYKQIDAFPGDLYDLVKVLACYKPVVNNKEISLQLDTAYCSGDVSKPVPNSKLDAQEFRMTDTDSDPERSDAVSVKDWVASIQALQSPDKLTQLDADLADGSFGGYGPKLESVYGGSRKIPLFEYRRLPGTPTKNFKTFVEAAEQAIIDYSQQYRDAPPRGGYK